MKMKSMLFAATLAVCAIVTGPIPGNADMAFTVDPGAGWNGYINAFELDGTTFATGFGEATVSLRSDFAGGPALPLSIQPHTRLYDEFWDGSNSSDLYWVNADGTPNKVIEANIYQEVALTIGEVVSFDWSVAANTLPAGYTAAAFIKVLDGGASWATTQLNETPLVPGSGSLSFTVADAGAGSEIVQAGFYIKGLAVTGTDPIALTGVTIIPEPSTFALALIGLVGLIARKRRV